MHDTTQPANRLAHEQSPYLRQHAHNPVDWHAWNAESIALARKLDRPIFLSVGYSTCYWCHVMERECFENSEIAELMNRLFINIKVDREERPDVDQLYMIALQAMTRSGGWPMSVFLTPDLRPIYAGTYFPPTEAHGRASFPFVLNAIAEAWRDRRDECEHTATQITKLLQQINDQPIAPPKPLGLQQISRLIDRSAADYDADNGGFGHAPKFPQETLLLLLLRAQRIAPAAPREELLRHTLWQMASGGVRDQLGGGFHRYSVDARWLVPHFEIMLYNQAMLGSAYAEASSLFDEPLFADVARGIYDFVLSDLTTDDGLFFTGLDAEVDAHEGQNYLWTPQQVSDVIGHDAERVNEAYGLAEGPNFEDPHDADAAPSNVLFLAEGLELLRDEHLASMRQQLLTARRSRKQPRLDDKSITTWNALMIQSLADASRSLGEPRYEAAAKRAMLRLLELHTLADGSLARSSRLGEAKIRGFFDDYAQTFAACVAMWRLTADTAMREQANRIRAEIERRFADGEGGYFFTESDQPDMIVRQRIATDSPLPAAVAVYASALLELREVDTVQTIIDRISAELSSSSASMSATLEVALRLAAAQQLRGHPANDQLVSTTTASPSPLTLRGYRDGERAIQLALELADGFHIGPFDGDDATSRLRVEGWTGELTIQSPSAITLGTTRGHVGVVRLRIEGSQPLPRDRVTCWLIASPCDESRCLEPQRLGIEL